MLGTSADTLTSRGVKFIRFNGLEKYGHQHRKLEVSDFGLFWNEFCGNFDPLIDVVFYLQPKAVVVRIVENPTGAVYSMFLNPTERKIAAQAQEISQPKCAPDPLASRAS